jgi:hypothetical protein
MMIADGQVLLELRPIGLAVPDKVEYSAPCAVIDWLGVAGE